ncbi:RICIN domain-containing protein [Archangium violaceum]|uniref:RICIN domain-containing protein n=1 Tax=Archangium violaceum TaxID=83451 RepID=UPI00193C444C|nr:RICIN domain-containing protein [Archangium violaceum]QRK05073.1 RICIN domain-containing protein [Archangium violaceum]
MKRMMRMAMVAAATFGMGAAARAEEPPLAITLKDSEQVLTVGGSAGKDEDAVVLSPFQLQPGQGFSLKPVGNPEDRLFNIISQQSGKCVDVKDGSREEGAPIVQRPCNGAECQVFHVSERGTDGHRELRNKLSDKCMAAHGGGATTGNSLIQANCTSQDEQRFRISAPQTTASTVAQQRANPANE